jgi:serine/threonine-protein kinase
MLSRMTFEGTNRGPLWTPDAARLTFWSSRDGNLYWKSSDGSGETERLTTSERPHVTNGWAPDGKKLIFTERSPSTGRDLMILHVNDDKRTEPFLQTPYNEGAARFSPDGRWISYVSDETGRPEIYVRPFPGPGSKWRISSDGGTEAMWSRDGREIFFRDGYKMYAVDIDTRSAFRPGKPRLLFERRYTKAIWSAVYDVAPDGRFIMHLESEESSAEPQVNVIVNWMDLLDPAN